MKYTSFSLLYSAGIHLVLFLLIFVFMKPVIKQTRAVYTIDFIGSSAQPARFGDAGRNGAAAQPAPQQEAAKAPESKPEEIKTTAPQPLKKADAKAYNSEQQIAKKPKKNAKTSAKAPAKPEAKKEEKVVLKKPSILGEVDSSNIDPSALHSISEGGEGLNAVRASFTNFPYPWYVTLVRNALWREWSKRMPKKAGLSALVSFNIDKNGAIYSVQIEKSSANESYDYAAASAVHNSAPYPPLPKEFPKDILTVTVEFKNEE
jgi:protein TonB